MEDIARQRLAADPHLINQPQDAVYRELMGEIDRCVALAVWGEARMDSLTGIRSSSELWQRHRCCPSRVLPRPFGVWCSAFSTGRKISESVELVLRFTLFG